MKNKIGAGSVALADVLMELHQQGLGRNLRKTPKVAGV